MNTSSPRGARVSDPLLRWMMQGMQMCAITLLHTAAAAMSTSTFRGFSGGS